MLRSLIYGEAVDDEYGVEEIDEEQNSRPRILSEHEASCLAKSYMPQLGYHPEEKKCLSSKIDCFYSEKDPSNMKSYYSMLPPPVSYRKYRKSHTNPRHINKIGLKRLLASFLADHDYSGAARVAAVLHKIYRIFDPELHRATFLLLRIGGNHSLVMRYFRKVIAKSQCGSLGFTMVDGIPLMRSFLSYLADTQSYSDGLSILAEVRKKNGPIAKDPYIVAYGGFLLMVMAILNVLAAAQEEADSKRSVDKEKIEIRVPDLRDPLDPQLLVLIRKALKSGRKSSAYINVNEARWQFQISGDPFLTNVHQPGVPSVKAYLAIILIAEKKLVDARSELLTAALAAGSSARDYELLSRFSKIYFNNDVTFRIASAAGWLRLDPVASFPLYELHSLCRDNINEHFENFKNLKFSIALAGTRHVEQRGVCVPMTFGVLIAWEALAWSLGPLNVRDIGCTCDVVSESYSLLPQNLVMHPFLRKLNIDWWEKIFFSNKDPLFALFCYKYKECAVNYLCSDDEADDFPQDSCDGGIFFLTPSEEDEKVAEQFDLETYGLGIDMSCLKDALLEAPIKTRYNEQSSKKMNASAVDKVNTKSLNFQDVFLQIEEEAEILGVRKKPRIAPTKPLNKRVNISKNSLRKNRAKSDFQLGRDPRGKDEFDNVGIKLITAGLKKEEMVKHEEVVKNTDSILGGSSSKDDSSDEDDPFGLNRIFSQSQSQSTLLGTNATQENDVKEAEPFLVPADAAIPVGMEAAGHNKALDDAGLTRLLVAKCVVAAHFLGPRHPYCLTALNYLARPEITSKEQRDALRNIGFQLKVALGQYQKLKRAKMFN